MWLIFPKATMKRFFKHLQGFGFFLSVYLYLVFKQQVWKIIHFKYKGHSICLRPGKSDFNVLNQIFVDTQYDSYNYIKNPEIIVDGGANIGLSTIFFKMKFPNSKIFCIEPELGNFQILESNTVQYENIELIRKGLWGNTTSIFLNKGAFTVDNYISLSPTESTIEEILCISISDLMKEFNLSKIDILKLDIEGAEKNILCSNIDWLDNVGCLMIETHDRMVSGTGKALFDAMHNYNFDLEVQGETMKFFNISRKIV